MESVSRALKIAPAYSIITIALTITPKYTI